VYTLLADSTYHLSSKPSPAKLANDEAKPGLHLERAQIVRTRTRSQDIHHALLNPPPRTVCHNNYSPPTSKPSTLPLRHTYRDLRLLPTRPRPCRHAKSRTNFTFTKVTTTTPRALPPPRQRYLPIRLQQLLKHWRTRTMLLTQRKMQC